MSSFFEVNGDGTVSINKEGDWYQNLSPEMKTQAEELRAHTEQTLQAPAIFFVKPETAQTAYLGVVLGRDLHSNAAAVSMLLAIELDMRIFSDAGYHEKMTVQRNGAVIECVGRWPANPTPETADVALEYGRLAALILRETYRLVQTPDFHGKDNQKPLVDGYRLERELRTFGVEDPDVLIWQATNEMHFLTADKAVTAEGKETVGYRVGSDMILAAQRIYESTR